MWPCGHSQNVVMAQGNNMEVAPGRDVTCGHVGMASNGGGTGQSDGDGTGHGSGTWPSGHSSNMEVALSMDVA